MLQSKKFKDLTEAQKNDYLYNLQRAVKSHDKLFDLGQILINAYKEIQTLHEENKDVD